MLNLYIFQPFGQVMLTCQRQTDCIVGKYCNQLKQCADCNLITKYFCDSLTDCCDIFFNDQCHQTKYICHSNKHEKNISINKLHLFLYLFIVLTITYLFTGCYYNVSMHQATGWNIIPHKKHWKQLFGLVKDGFYFTYSNIQSRYHHNYNQIKI